MRVANNRASRPFSLNQTGTLLNRHLAQFVSAIDNHFLIWILKLSLDILVI